MITFTTAQLDYWITSLVFPLSRILGMLAFAPAFSNLGLPRHIRMMAGVFITLAIIPVLPPIPSVPAGSWIAIFMLVQEAMIGILFGISLRIAFATIDFAGDLIGLQMGLSFASFYDPQHGGQTPVVTEFISLLALLIFLAMNGHLLTITLLVESFQVLPISVVPFASKGFTVFITWAATMFSYGLLLSLPLVAALLVTNLSLGVLSRVAPQLNLFAVGFPVTIMIGFIVFTLSLPYLGVAIESLIDQGFMATMSVMRAGGALP